MLRWRLASGECLGVHEWSSLDAALAAATEGAQVVETDRSDPWMEALEVSRDDGTAAVVVAGEPGSTVGLLLQEWAGHVWLEHGRRLYRLTTEPWAVRWIEFDTAVMAVRVIPDPEGLVVVCEGEVVLLDVDLQRVGSRLTDLVVGVEWTPGGVRLEQLDEPPLELAFESLEPMIRLRADSGVEASLSRLRDQDADLRRLIDAARASGRHNGVVDMLFMGVLAREVSAAWGGLSAASRVALWAEVERCCQASDADESGSAAHLWLVGFVEAFWNGMVHGGRDAGEVTQVLPASAREYVAYWTSITGG